MVDKYCLYCRLLCLKCRFPPLSDDSTAHVIQSTAVQCLPKYMHVLSHVLYPTQLAWPVQLVDESPGKVQESTAEELLACLKKLQALKNSTAPSPPAGKAPGSSDQQGQ